MAKIQNTDDELINSILKGSLWNEIKLQFSRKIVLPLTLYFDDFEVRIHSDLTVVSTS